MRTFAFFLILTLGTLAIPSATAIQKEFYQHRGSDTAEFDSLRRSIDNEENRRRLDDQDNRARLSEHDRQISALMVRMNIVEEWQKEANNLMRAIFLAVLGAGLAATFAAWRSHKGYRMIQRSLYWDRRTERRKQQIPPEDGD